MLITKSPQSRHEVGRWSPSQKLYSHMCVCNSKYDHIDFVLSMQFAVLPLRFTCICVFTCLYCQCAMLWHYLYSRTVTAVTAVRCGRSHDQSLENLLYLLSWQMMPSVYGWE